MRFDIHVHTEISPCSQLRIAEVLENAIHLGLDGVCLTDHDTMEIRRWLKEGIQRDGLCIIFGMEYTTPDGDFLLFGPFEDLSSGLPATELLNIVNETGGVAVAAHPFRVNRPVREYVVREGLCNIIESCNGRNADDENLQTGKWLQKYLLTECGGSDAHSLDELGKVATRIKTPVRSRNDFICALKNGLCKPEKTAAKITSFQKTEDRKDINGAFLTKY